MKVPFAGIVDGQEEEDAVIRAMRSGWHGCGPEAEAFEQEFADYLDTDHALLVNSGSSANLLALKALNLDQYDKVITSGCGFPATLNPILHLGLEPILVDYDIRTQNIDLDQVENALEEEGVGAIIVAHTMGNPIDMPRLMKAANSKLVYVIEDCCEALGATIDGKQVGTFGELGTFSFYPSHQINGLGGGGCVVTDDTEFAVEMRSLRNWGKLVRTPHFSGDHVTEYTNTIDGILYDDQYTYQTVGFNLQATDIQAAYLREQLKRLPELIKQRQQNWEYLYHNLTLETVLVMQQIPTAEPSYFGFTLVTPGPEFRNQFASYLENNGIRTRPFFAGNITRHEPYRELFKPYPVADQLMCNALFVGVWPGLDLTHMKYVTDTINSFNSTRIVEFAKDCSNVQINYPQSIDSAASLFDASR